MALVFEVFDADSGAFSYTGEPYRSLLPRLHDVLEARESGQLSEKRYLTALDELLAAAPDFLGAHTHVALYWHQQGKPKKALDAALLGLGAANRLIPEGYAGTIDWRDVDNRAYLRSMHVALMSYIRLRRHRDAVVLCEQMLARNPNDNQGVRYLIGSEALRADEYRRAGELLAAHAPDYPPCWYELGLLHTTLGKWLPAATALRRGFAANPYIAEILGGNPRPALQAVWHQSNFAEPETARDYLGAYQDLWHANIHCLPFARWLFNHPLVLAERAAIMACREALLREQDHAARARLAAKEQALIAAIDDKLSAAIVTGPTDAHGRLIPPWLIGQAEG